jgi:hypothetical protein
VASIFPTKDSSSKLTVSWPEQSTATLSDTEQQALTNDRNRLKLLLAGESDPTASKGPSPMDRVFGVLDTPGTAVRSLMHNAVSNEDVNVGQEVLKALKGEKRVEGSDILKDMGVSNKWAQMLGGLALDIFTDPTAYLTGGLSTLTKAESAVKLAKLATEGISAAKLADYGVDITKLSSTAQKLLEGDRLIKASELAKDDSRVIASAVRAATGAAKGDYGGIKLAGMTVLPAQQKLEKATYALKDIARADSKLTKPLQWAEKAFVNGDLTPITSLGNEVVNAGVKQSLKNLSAGRTAARRLGAETEGWIAKLIPDAETRDLVTIGIGRQFQGVSQDVFDVLKKARDSGDENAVLQASEAVQGALAKAYHPEAIVDTLRQSGLSGEAALAKVKDAATQIQDHFESMRQMRGDKGLPNWERYSGYGSQGYVPGVTGLADKKAAQGALDKLGLTIGDKAPLAVDNLLTDAGKKQGITVSNVFHPTAYKSKEYANAEARMVEGGLLSELDIAKLANAKTAKDYSDIALKDFEDSIKSIVGVKGDAQGALADSLGKMRSTIGMSARPSRTLSPWRTQGEPPWRSLSLMQLARYTGPLYGACWEEVSARRSRTSPFPSLRPRGPRSLRAPQPRRASGS